MRQSKGKFDWDREAAQMAIHACDHMMEAHRGAFPHRRKNVAVIFGNDDYRGDTRAQQEVEIVQERLEGFGKFEVLGFGVDPRDDHEGYTWVMLVQTTGSFDNDLRFLFDLVWVAWEEAKLRKWEADGRQGPPPDSSWVQRQVAMGV